MNSNKVKFAITLQIVYFLTQISLHAQNTFSSPYSVYGIGMLHYRTSSLSRSIGGTGIAVQDEYSINPINPASYSSIKSPITHIHEIGLYIESNRYTSQSTIESKTSGGITNLNYWFKFAKWWSATAGLTPYSSVSYKIKTQRELATTSLVNYTYEGSGNINQLYLGNAFNVVKNLSVGVHAAYFFGNILKTESLDLYDGESYLTYENKIVARTFHFDFGLQYKINFKNKSLVIGIIADDGLTLTAKQQNALYDHNADTLSSGVGKTLKYKLPKYAGVGLSLNSKRYTIAADLKFEDWSNASYAKEEVVLQDTWKFSAGYIYKGNPEAENYFGLVSLRTGFNVQQYPLKLKGKSSLMWGWSAGVSLPMFDGKSALNLTYSMDQFGTVEDKLVLQRSQKFILDLVIRDLWGNKRRAD
ncbi:MAG TPA: hypothetical protein PKU83_01850 [Chryseolinea sp.]|nr:hypothetical protein [Chryseolinea sp.]